MALDIKFKKVEGSAGILFLKNKSISSSDLNELLLNNSNRYDNEGLQFEVNESTVLPYVTNIRYNVSYPLEVIEGNTSKTYNIWLSGNIEVDINDGLKFKTANPPDIRYFSTSIKYKIDIANPNTTLYKYGIETGNGDFNYTPTTITNNISDDTLGNISDRLILRIRLDGTTPTGENDWKSTKPAAAIVYKDGWNLIEKNTLNNNYKVYIGSDNYGYPTYEVPSYKLSKQIVVDTDLSLISSDIQTIETYESV